MGNKMELTQEQKYVLHAVVTNIRNGAGQITIGGYAGTGKTLLVKYLKQFFPNFGVCAYTGKAANILRSRGIDSASTIHSRIYTPTVEDGTMYFELAIDPGCSGFIVDEASMVSQEIYLDLKSFNLPIIFVGDHGQLEPIGSDFNLMQSPDYRLETIHRNAGDIARFAEYLRKGYASRGFKCKDGSVQLIHNITNEHLLNTHQVICAYNKTRVEYNNHIRKLLNRTELLHTGERIMCLRNNRQQNLFNGMQGKVVRIYQYKKKNHLDFETNDFVHEGIWFDTEQFGKETYKLSYGNKSNPFDYAYVITCHKAQGDEWPQVLVIEQKCRNWDHRRWAYTAASRARSKLVWKVG
jgi:exodeoxyribonuclease-5